MYKKSLIVFTMTAALLLCGCESSKVQNAMELPVVPVTAATPTVKDITIYLDSIGKLESSILMEVQPQIEGTLTHVLIKEGEWVEQNTPLFKIDSKLYAIKVQEAEAQVAVDRANLQAIQKKLNLMKPLAQKNLVAQTEWNDLEAELEKSQAVLTLDEARLNGAKLDLEHCTLYAPIAGRIGKIDAHAGHLITKGSPSPLATISQMNPLYVEFTVTEKEFSKIPTNAAQIEIKPLCSSDLSEKGMISFLDNHFDSTTGLLLIRGQIQNPKYTMRPGQSVRVQIPIGVSQQALLIPQKAIRYNQEGPYIYTIQSDMTVTERQLTLGDEHGNDQIVLKGLEPSEQFIVDGHLRLSPGIKVEVKS